MARDRKRAKQRRERRAPRGAASATHSELHRADLPGALEHASSEVDEFDAALVRGAHGVPLPPDALPPECPPRRTTVGSSRPPAPGSQPRLAMSRWASPPVAGVTARRSLPPTGRGRGGLWRSRRRWAGSRGPRAPPLAARTRRRLPARLLGGASACAVARPPPGLPGHHGRARLRRRRRRLPRRRRLGRPEDHQLHPLRPGPPAPVTVRPRSLAYKHATRGGWASLTLICVVLGPRGRTTKYTQSTRPRQPWPPLPSNTEPG